MKNLFVIIFVFFSSYSIGQIDPYNKLGPQLSPLSSTLFHCSKMHDHFEFDRINVQNYFQKIRSCPSSFQEWSALNNMALIEELKLYTDFECFRPLFSFEQQTGPVLFSRLNFVAACNEVLELLNSYTGEHDNGLYGLLNYLHAFIYHEFYQTSIDLDVNDIEILKNTILKFVNHPNAHAESEDALKNLAKVYILCDYDGIRSLANVVSAFKKSLKILTVDKTWVNYNNEQTYASYLIGYNIIYAVDRGVATTDTDFTNIIAADDNFVPLFKNLVTVTEFDQKQYYKDFPKLAMTELVRMCTVPSFEKKTVEAFASIAAVRPQKSSYWYRSVKAINMKGKCEEYNLCFNIDELRRDAINRLFPQKYLYEDGKYQINTPLYEGQAQKLYYASLQVQAQFFRLIESDTPLQDDLSDTLKIIIYGSRSDYEEWQYELFGLNTNNGGIYIERGSTFYSYERTPQESIYSLEELFRHEYTHYLIGRYIDPFFWGETVFYTNEQLTWFNEGMAEYLAGSTRLEKVKIRKSIATQLKSDVAKMNPSEIISAKYNEGFTFYRYSNAFVNYLIDENPTLFTKIINAIKSYSINQYDTAISEIKNDNTINAKFSTYLSDYTSDPSSWWVPVTDTININELKFSTLGEIDNYVVTKAWSDFQTSQSATFSLKRFKLVIDEEKALCEIDECLENLGNEEIDNNFYYAVGYPKKENGKAKYVITGPVNSLKVNTFEQGSNFNRVSVFPNPAHKQLEINLNTIIHKIILISHDGRIVEPKYDWISENRIIVDLNHLKNGLYHALVIDKKGKFHNASFVKQD